VGLRHLLGVDRDDAPPAPRVGPTRSIGVGDVLETASSGPLVVESVLPLGELGELCVAGDASTRRVLVVRPPSCWRLVPAPPGSAGNAVDDAEEGELAGARRVGGGVLGGGHTIEVFADATSISVVIGGGLVGMGAVLSCSVVDDAGEPVIWLPGGAAPAGIDDSYLALDAGDGEPPRAPSLLDTLGARERPIT